MSARTSKCSICREAGKSRCECRGRQPYQWKRAKVGEVKAEEGKAEEMDPKRIKAEPQSSAEAPPSQMNAEAPSPSEAPPPPEELAQQLKTMTSHYYTAKAAWSEEHQKLKTKNKELRDELAKVGGELAKEKEKAELWMYKCAEERGKKAALEGQLQDMKDKEAARLEANRQWRQGEGKAGKGETQGGKGEAKGVKVEAKGGKVEAKGSKGEAKGGKGETINMADL